MSEFESFEDVLGWDSLYAHRLRFLILKEGGEIERRGFIYLSLDSLAPVLADLLDSAEGGILLVRLETRN